LNGKIRFAISLPWEVMLNIRENNKVGSSLSLKSMKILVIGGSGFIGTALVGRFIDLGYETSIFDKNPSGYFNHLVTIKKRNRGTLPVFSGEAED
jgi:hypothetical protein